MGFAQDKPYDDMTNEMTHAWVTMNKHTTPTTHKRPRAPEEAPKRVTVLNLQFENYYDNYHSNSYRTSIGATQNITTNIFQHHTIYSF